MSLLCRLKNLVHKGLLKKEDLDRIAVIPKGQENKVIQMRDATPEERESINKYVNNISKLTGISFDNLEQGSCEDYVNREFIEIVVEYPPADLCIYPEYKGKPYYSIKYQDICTDCIDDILAEFKDRASGDTTEYIEINHCWDYNHTIKE